MSKNKGINVEKLPTTLKKTNSKNPINPLKTAKPEHVAEKNYYCFCFLKV